MALLLVTGARGAIGQHVVAIARGRGHRVLGLGHGAWAGDPDLPEIDGWLNGGIDADNLAGLVRRDGPPEVVIHLAGGALVGASIAQPGEDFRRTVDGSQRLLEWLRTSAPHARLVIASSAAVYGDGLAGPILETAPLAPASPYGTHKAMVELQARSYARQFGLAVVLVRLFSVYGPGLRKQLIWDLTGRLVRGERPLRLGGTGTERRDFLFIANAAAMLLDAASLASAAAPAFNGSGGGSQSVADIAGQVARLFEGAQVAFSGQSRAGDPHALVGDATQARQAGLVAPTSLEEGMPATVAWIRASLLRSTQR